MKWISVFDMTPEGHVNVLVRFDDGEMAVGWGVYWHGAKEGVFAGFVFPFDEIAEGREVSHWMPLPAAPEVEE
jgi:hypothetical protein